MTQKSKRLYFTDPIKALYMMQEFGVKISREDIFSILCAIRDNRVDLKFYVTKESESIFEPIKGDKMWINLEKAGEKIYTFSKGALYWRNAKIIMRNGKHFFMPEVEDD